MLDQLGWQGRVALGAILGAVVAALCCFGLFTANDGRPLSPENLLPMALTSEPAVVTGVAGPTNTAVPAGIAVTMSTVTTTASIRSTTTTMTTAARTVRTTTIAATTTRTTTTTRQPTTTVPPTTTTTRPCSLLFC